MDRAFWIQKTVHVFVGLAILIISFIIANAAQNAIYKQNASGNFAVVMTGHMIYYTIIIIGILILLRLFGIEITSIIAILTALGFAIGLSLQGSLSDIASGILITFFNVYNIGDIITVGEVEGKVIDFKLIHTIIEELNTKAIVTIPNRDIQGKSVQNITKQGYHYFIIDMLVSNRNKDFDHIRSVIHEALKDTKKFPMILQNHPHRVSIADMSGVGTTLRIRVPLTTDDDVAVKRGDFRNALRPILDANNIILLDPTAIAKA